MESASARAYRNSEAWATGKTSPPEGAAEPTEGNVPEQERQRHLCDGNLISDLISLVSARLVKAEHDQHGVVRYSPIAEVRR